MVLLDVIAGKRPARPPHREALGLGDLIWNMIQKCWDSDPQNRPAIKNVRSLLGPASWRWAPPSSEEINDLDLDSSGETNVDSTAAYTTCTYTDVGYYVVLTSFAFSAHSGGFLGSAGTSAGSRANMSDAALHGSIDRYVDFTSYSDGTDPYRPHSGTEQSVGNPSGTPLSSDAEGSPRSIFLQETMLVPHRTQEWVQAQQSDLPFDIFPRRPGVTFEESPIVHIIPPSSPETRTVASDDSYEFLRG